MLGGEVISSISETKYLGVTLSNNYTGLDFSVEAPCLGHIFFGPING